jgi:hypothetical protein
MDLKEKGKLRYSLAEDAKYSHCLGVVKWGSNIVEGSVCKLPAPMSMPMHLGCQRSVAVR